MNIQKILPRIPYGRAPWPHNPRLDQVSAEIAERWQANEITQSNIKTENSNLGGRFDWSVSPEKRDYWHDVFLGIYPAPTDAPLAQPKPKAGQIWRFTYDRGRQLDFIITGNELAHGPPLAVFLSDGSTDQVKYIKFDQPSTTLLAETFKEYLALVSEVT